MLVSHKALRIALVLGFPLVCVSNAFPQPAEVKFELAGPVFPACSASVDGALLWNAPYTLKISAKASALQDGATLGFIVYSPDGSYSNLSFTSQPTMSVSWGSTAYWNLGGGYMTSMVDGFLPDSFLTGGVTLPGGGFLEPNFVDIVTLGFITPSYNGILCFDSAFIPPIGNWLMSPDGPPVFHGGIGDTGVGGASEDALCFEVKPGGGGEFFPSFPLAQAGPYCLPITFQGFFIDADPGQSNGLVGFSHNGNGVLTQIDDITFTYTPDSSDAGNIVTLQFDGEIPTIDICGNPILWQTSAFVDLTITAPCPDCCFLAGDADHDGMLNIADVTFAIAHIFSGGAAPVCINEADANGDNAFNIADVTHLIQFIFNGGSAPVCGTTGV